MTTPVPVTHVIDEGAKRRAVILWGILTPVITACIVGVGIWMYRQDQRATVVNTVMPMVQNNQNKLIEITGEQQRQLGIYGEQIKHNASRIDEIKRALEGPRNP